MSASGPTGPLTPIPAGVPLASAPPHPEEN